MSKAKLILDGKEIELEVVEGSEGEMAVDISSLRQKTGYVTLDPGYGNTGSCLSDVTFIDGEKGILRYRGYPIEQLAEKGCFSEICYLLIYGELPTQQQLDEWRRQLTMNSFVHESMLSFFNHFPPTSHPMDVLSAMIASMPAFYQATGDDDQDIIRIIAKAKTLAAVSYKKSIGEPIIYPRTGQTYAANFMRMMFATPAEDYKASPVIDRAMDLLLILHADHEQNCSTSTARMVGSSQASLYASVSAAIGGLSGPLHGGANQQVIEMLKVIHESGGDYKGYLEKVKDKNANVRLMGFGHRVYKNFDPRAKILKKACDDVLDELKIDEPLLDIAKNMERIALEDSYFVERKLYPNVDFY
ncbi:MAG: citrate (Si)-synthase, partial [Candidatus Hydrogenedentes bacterium]|nr:citrate (Si)-synthase [Candidatus Hydrogenedentota bacterium]